MSVSVRIVADTNTVVSGLLWSGPPQQLINAARAKQITFYSSVALIAERVRIFRAQAKLDMHYLRGVLTRHQLEARWNEWKG